LVTGRFWFVPGLVTGFFNQFNIYIGSDILCSICAESESEEADVVEGEDEKAEKLRDAPLIYINIYIYIICSNPLKSLNLGDFSYTQIYLLKLKV
jgi:hypothetical protein